VRSNVSKIPEAEMVARLKEVIAARKAFAESLEQARTALDALSEKLRKEARS
jgi:hypothetical protein